jgi:hypothetical protein
MECSKCRIVKERGSFYATGRVCKDCKREYARKYRGSRGSDAGTDDASTRTVTDGIVDMLHRIEDDVAELKEAKCRADLADTELSHRINKILEYVQRIDETVSKLATAASSAPIWSHPLLDLEVADENTKK